MGELIRVLGKIRVNYSSVFVCFRFPLLIDRRNSVFCVFFTKMLDVLFLLRKTILINTLPLMQWWGVGYLELQGMPIYLFIAIVIIYKNKMCFPICILATISSDGWCLSFANFPKGSSVRLCCFGHSNSGLWQQWLLARIINHTTQTSHSFTLHDHTSF